MACDLWGASPLYENEDLKVGRTPTVTPIDQVRDEGNCGEVTNRVEEACDCAGMAKLFLEKEKPDIALRRLKEIVAEYSGSAAAAEAKSLLKKL